MAARKDVGLMAPYGAQTKILAEPPQARLTNEESRRARASLNQSLSYKREHRMDPSGRPAAAGSKRILVFFQKNQYNTRPATQSRARCTHATASIGRPLLPGEILARGWFLSYNFSLSDFRAHAPLTEAEA